MKKLIILIILLISQSAYSQIDLFNSSYPDTSLFLSKNQYNSDTANLFRLNNSETVTGALTTFSGKVVLNDIVNISDSLRLYRKEFPGSTSPYVIQVDSANSTDFYIKIQQLGQVDALVLLQNTTTGFGNADGGLWRMSGLNMITRNFETTGTIRWITNAGDMTLSAAGNLTNTGHYLVTTDNTYDLGALGTEMRNIHYQGTLFGILDTPPATAGATGVAGEIRFGTDGYLYLCTATDTWLRVQLVTW